MIIVDLNYLEDASEAVIIGGTGNNKQQGCTVTPWYTYCSPVPPQIGIGGSGGNGGNGGTGGDGGAGGAGGPGIVNTGA